MEELKRDVSVIANTLEEEGILPLDELTELTNLDKSKVLQALELLHREEKVQLFQHGKVLSAMLVL